MHTKKRKVGEVGDQGQRKTNKITLPLDKLRS